MLLLNPRRVSFGGASWERVTSVAIEPEAVRGITEWGDDGPHVVHADVPEQRVTVTVTQELLGEDMDTPTPGEQETLSFVTARNSSGSRERAVSLIGVIQGVKYRVSKQSGSSRVIELIAVSTDGSADPVDVSAV